MRIKMVVTALFLSCVFYSGCSAQEPRQEPIILDYPAEISVASLQSGFNPQFGMTVIGRASGLNGNLCWVGRKNHSAQLDTTDYKKSVFQRLDINDGSVVIAYNFELPRYQQANVRDIRYPVFRANRDICFIRVMTDRYDVGSYRLYEINLKTNSGRVKEGKIRRDELYLHDKILVSPDGKYYAYETAEPYSGAHPKLVVKTDEEEKNIVRESRSAEDFSWSAWNNIILPDAAKKIDKSKNYFYPNIYEDDLKGNSKLLKEGGSRPLINPKGKHLASFVPYIDPKSKPVDREDPLFEQLSYDSLRVKRVALSVYDLSEKVDNFVTRIYEEYPTLFWSKNGDQLYVIENFYVFSKKTAFCRVSVYDIKTKNYRLLCKLEQKGEAASYDDEKLLPRFTPIKIANDKYILLQVPVKLEGKCNYHVVTVNVENGMRNDILSFTDSISSYDVPLIDWIDSK